MKPMLQGSLSESKSMLQLRGVIFLLIDTIKLIVDTFKHLINSFKKNSKIYTSFFHLKKKTNALSWKFSLSFEVEHGDDTVDGKFSSLFGKELVWTSPWLDDVAETCFITYPTWCHHSSIAS